MLDKADEDDDLFVSDSELLKGAVVKGKSKSPVKAQARPEEIVLDSEEDEEETETLPRVLTQVSREEPLPWSPTPPKAARREASAEVIPDSDEEMADFLLPRPTVRTRSTTPEKSASLPAHEEPAAQEDDLDEFSFFELPDEAMDAALDIAPANVIQARAPPLPPLPLPVLTRTSSPTAVVLEVDLDEDDSALMPPPPSASKVRPPPQPQYRPRPHHHRIPDSDSSEPPKSASRPQAAALPRPPQSMDASFDNSPVVVAGRRGTAKRTVVIRSSSPQAEPAPRAVPSSTSAFRFAPDLSDSPAQPAPKALNRLRRGRQVVEDDEEEDDDAVQVEEEYDEPLHSAPKPKLKSKKAKRIKLTEKAAARSKLFDMEAVNSSADEPEPSSEAYATEDSDDRRFVASEDGDLEDVSPGQAQFYRESLMSQAPAAFTTRLGRFGGNGANRRRSGGRAVAPGTPMTPMTPNSQDQWR